MMTFCLFLLVLTGPVFSQEQDALLQKNMKIQTKDIGSVLGKTEDDVKKIVEYFDIQLDKGSKLVSAKQVGGTQNHPVLKASVKKCVFVICQTIDLDIEFHLEKIKGKCDVNYLLHADLQRSSQILTDLYSELAANICVKENTTGGTLALDVALIRADSYQSGIIQRTAFGLIQLQADALLESLVKVLKFNGADAVIL